MGFLYLISFYNYGFLFIVNFYYFAPKFINLVIISGIYKLIIFIIISIFSYFELSILNYACSIFLFFLLITSFFFSSNKIEYIIIYVLMFSFWSLFYELINIINIFGSFFEWLDSIFLRRFIVLDFSNFSILALFNNFCYNYNNISYNVFDSWNNNLLCRDFASCLHYPPLGDNGLGENFVVSFENAYGAVFKGEGGSINNKSLPEWNFSELYFYFFFQWLSYYYNNITLHFLNQYDVYSDTQMMIAKQENFSVNNTSVNNNSFYYEDWQRLAKNWTPFIDSNGISSDINLIEITDDINSFKSKFYDVNNNITNIRFLFKNFLDLHGGFDNNKLDWSLYKQLDSVWDQIEIYKNEQIKWENVIIRIENGKENFYPDYSINSHLITIKLINQLIINLESLELDIISNIPLPDQTQQELDQLENPIFIPLPNQTEQEINKLENPICIPLPEQTKEEIDSLLESEDFFSEALEGMGLFSED